MIKKIAGTMRLALAQYRELEAFSQFASTDEATRKQLERGQRTIEILKQPQYQPLGVPLMAISLYLIEAGFVDNVDVAKVREFETELHEYLKISHADMLEAIAEKPVLSDEMKAQIDQALTQFKSMQG